MPSFCGVITGGRLKRGVWLHPIVLGSGKRLFAENAFKRDLKLIDATTTTSGLVIVNYRRRSVR